MFGIGFGVFAVAILFFCMVRPDRNKDHALSPPIVYGIVGGLVLMLASICTWLFRVLP